MATSAMPRKEKKGRTGKSWRTPGGLVENPIQMEIQHEQYTPACF